MDDEAYEGLWTSAWEYNSTLLERSNRFLLDDARKEQYAQLLNVGGNGIMGYVEIPAINVTLPIYHGTEEAVLQVAVGHLKWTNLPVGGGNSHCVISGHRGLPSAKLFADRARDRCPGGGSAPAADPADRRDDPQEKEVGQLKKRIILLLAALLLAAALRFGKRESADEN